MAEGRLKEVEEDAIYITEKRFADQREEYQRELAKREREESKANKVESAGSTYVPEDKKGK